MRNPGDAGPGTLREALERANRDARIQRIELAAGLDVRLQSAGLVYTGAQALTLGGAATITGGGPFALLTVTSGASLALEGLQLSGSALDAVVIQVPAEHTATVAVRLQHVAIENNQGFGLHIDDLGGSPAGVELEVSDTSIGFNGAPSLVGGELDDRDGIRVDERGDGGIEASFRDVDFQGNAYDGLELDEGGAGGVVLRVRGSAFDNNGFGSLPGPSGLDYDDGVDIDEDGPGDVEVDVRASTANDNAEEGWDFTEGGEGSLLVRMREVEVRGNDDTGLKLKESPADSEAGDVRLALDCFDISDNRDGIKLSERRVGSVEFSARHGELWRNDDAVSLIESEEGSLKALLEDVIVSESRGTGLGFTETSEGDLDVSLRSVEASNNAGMALEALQLDVGLGKLETWAAPMTGNRQDVPRLLGVQQQPAAEAPASSPGTPAGRRCGCRLGQRAQATTQ